MTTPIKPLLCPLCNTKPDHVGDTGWPDFHGAWWCPHCGASLISGHYGRTVTCRVPELVQEERGCQHLHGATLRGPTADYYAGLEKQFAEEGK